MLSKTRHNSPTSTSALMRIIISFSSKGDNTLKFNKAAVLLLRVVHGTLINALREERLYGRLTSVNGTMANGHIIGHSNTRD